MRETAFWVLVCRYEVTYTPLICVALLVPYFCGGGRWLRVNCSTCMPLRRVAAAV